MTKFQTILIVIGTALAIPLGTALLSLDAAALDNPGAWARSLILGFANALGTLLLARFTTGGLTAGV